VTSPSPHCNCRIPRRSSPDFAFIAEVVTGWLQPASDGVRFS